MSEDKKILVTIGGECFEVEYEGAGNAYRRDGVPLWFAKTLADFEINNIAALPPLFCYNS
jgi:hypothetical protein